MADTQDDKIVEDFPEMVEEAPEASPVPEGVEASEIEENPETPVVQEAKEEKPAVDYSEYDKKLEAVIEQNAKKFNTKPDAEESGLNIDLSHLEKDSGDEITNEINKAVLNIVKNNIEPVLNKKITGLQDRVKQSEAFAKKQSEGEVKQADQQFRETLIAQGHDPDMYVPKLQKYVNSLPREQVDMVFKNAKGVKSALIFQTMFEADMGNITKTGYVDVEAAREQGERKATERLRANPASGSGGSIATPKGKTWNPHAGESMVSDSDWEKLKHNISDEEAFGF